MNRNFRNFVLQNFPFLEDDFDALTDYQLFCKMMAYVKQFAKDNEEFREQLEKLQPYVDNKLDEMAEDGTLADIINEEIFEDLNDEIGDLSNLTTSNKSSLVNAINEVNGDIVPFYGIIRPTSSGWTLLSDSQHSPLNVQSIAIDDINSARLKLTHNVTGAGKVYSFSINPDETLTKYGIRAGASVGISESYIYMYQSITANAYFRYQNGAFNLQAGYSNLVKSFDYDSTKHCLHIVFDDNLKCNTPERWYADFNFNTGTASAQLPVKLKVAYTNLCEVEVYAYDDTDTLIETPGILDRVNVFYQIERNVTPANLITYPITGANFWICGYLKKTS